MTDVRDMENTEKWNKCLAMIREEVNDQWVYDTWFAPVTFEHYDPDMNTVLLQVPDRYVYEFVDHYYAKMLSRVLTKCFSPDHRCVTLQYRVARQEPVAAPAIDYPPLGQIPRFTIANARERIEKGLRHYLGDSARWLPAYDRVADWLSDNKGRGLLCIGTPGLGKTLLCEKILPVIFGRKVRTVNALELAEHIDDLVNERCIIIDDLGHEPATFKKYGNLRRPFFELCDAAERRGILLVITTNLSTNAVNNPLYPDSIERMYGPEVLSRLRATVHVVKFEGKDFRA